MREDKYDESNPLALPSKKQKTQRKVQEEVKVKKLSKKQRKVLEKVIEKKKKKGKVGFVQILVCCLHY